MDIWESNSISNAYTSHPCSVTSKAGGSYRCESATECGTGTTHRYDGLCDKDGCDFNPYRMGNKTFFGPGSDFTIDTTKKFTVVTRFITDDDTASGTLSDIKRFYIQGGATYEMPYSTWSGLTDMNSLADDQCSAAKKVFGDKDDHKTKGGLAQLGLAMKRGMVLTMSLWTDHAAKCLWLDSDYPVTADVSKAGVARGTCAKTSGDPDTVVSEQADATVVFSNIRFGAIGTTIDGISSTSSTTETSTSGSSASTSTSATTSAPSASTASSGSSTSASSTSTSTMKPSSTTSTDTSDETSADADNASTSSVASESSQGTSVTTVPVDGSTDADSASTKAPTKQCKTKRY
ncbi:hypothetical protein PF005_g7348 [Phytophthora fragariae]|uniref:cellulose 1,4-beta-cellobiosidase (non-reducing end) n=1 Tax=Phytophthora fragariae TaxID=53985 RepID=A0A6A3TWP6_9STRA|nr:hypothetical protein PF009_g8093 [Phytophthora fragariae]KAE9006906.1 hypothetical protein PF011_g11362 [Phytophthora fragariae]KAE9105870.1 hypothetical protein PF010_g12845 [Phytophthora fragariae]KAE9122136.1 hypothetical protein PF007_g7560 [Phytophthora fragariae]KAE9143562.1 hypothetical protein PF006_g11430 [Phytophthora fragariae]